MPMLPFRSGTSPWQELRELREQMDRIIGSAFGGGRGGEAVEWAPAVDIAERDDQLVLTAELPGIQPEDINIELENNVLTIRGEKRQEHEERGRQRYVYERQYGGFARSFTLPRAVSADEIHARFEDGVLTITMPKMREARGKQIEIETGRGQGGHESHGGHGGHEGR